MEQKNENKLLMPHNYHAINGEEMQYIEGGNTFSFKCTEAYKNKVNCYNYANAVIRYHGITGMTQLEVAAEIYAHAQIYYFIRSIQTNKIFTESIRDAVFADLLRRAEMIDVESGGDTRLGFKQAYNWIWNHIG